MSDRPITPRNHPFPFLLYVEWGLLAIALLSDLVVGHPPRPGPRFLPPPPPAFSALRTLGILGFGVMGLRLPTRLASAIPYTMLQLGWLVLVTLISGRRFQLFPMLYIVLVMRGCLMFQRSGRVAVAFSSFAVFASLLLSRLRLRELIASPDVRDRIRPFFLVTTFNSILALAVALVFVVFLINALMAERASRDRLANANRQLRDYALRVETLAMEQERNRIARDIHDSLGHSLTALNLQLETALKLWPKHPEKAQAFLQTAKNLGSTALQEVRQSVSALRTDPLQHQSLEGAIATLLQNFQTSTHIQPHSTLRLPAHLPAPLRTSLYRILQEALTNIAKHAQATQVTLQLSADAEQLHLHIQDNGIGFDPAQNATGFGLQSIQERTLALNGTCQIHSAPHQGTTLDITLPLSQPETSQNFQNPHCL